MVLSSKVTFGFLNGFSKVKDYHYFEIEITTCSFCVHFSVSIHLHVVTRI